MPGGTPIAQIIRIIPDAAGLLIISDLRIYEVLPECTCPPPATGEIVDISEFGDTWYYRGAGWDTGATAANRPFPYPDYDVATTNPLNTYGTDMTAGGITGWGTGPAPIGFGAVPSGLPALATAIPYTDNNTAPAPTGDAGPAGSLSGTHTRGGGSNDANARLWYATMFKKTFDVPAGVNFDEIVNVVGKIAVTDGAIIFINGVEVYRDYISTSTSAATSTTLGEAITFNGTRAGAGSSARAAASRTFTINDNTLTATGSGAVWSKAALVSALQHGENVITVIQTRAQGSRAGGRLLYFDLELSIEFWDGSCPVCDPDNDGIACTCPVQVIPAAGISYTNETLTGLANNANYTVNGAARTSSATGTIAIDAAWIGTSIEIVRLGSNIAKHSPVQTLAIPARPILSGVTANPTTNGMPNGSINGLTTAMQYRIGGGAWTTATTASITGLGAVSVQVRLLATPTTFASAITTLHIAASACPTCAHLWNLNTTNIAEYPTSSSSNTTLNATFGPGATTLPGTVGNNNVLQLSGFDPALMNAPEITLILNNRPGAHEQTNGTLASNNRAVYVWTDLSTGTGTIDTVGFALDNHSSGQVVRVTAAYVGAQLVLTIPGNLLKQGTTVATEIYVAIGQNSSAALDNFSGHAFRQRFNNAVITSVPLCQNCGACKGAIHDADPLCECDPVVHMFPLPVNKSPAQNHSDQRKGWSGESATMQFDSPLGGATTHAEMTDAGLRYIVIDFKEAPADFGIVIQGAAADGRPIGSPYLTSAPANLYNVSATPSGTTSVVTTGWFGGYMAESSYNVPGLGTPKVSDTLYVFDLGNSVGSGHFPAKWVRATWTAPAEHNAYWFLHPGYSRNALYGSFQLLFETNNVSFEWFISNIENAYITNVHPNDVPIVPEVQVWPASGTSSLASGNVLQLNTTGQENLKLHYNGTLSGNNAVRMQYSIDGGTTWKNIHQDFSIIRTSGPRVELLPAETYNQPDLRIRWVPHGSWGRTWAQSGGSYSLSGIKLTTGLQHGEKPRPLSPVASIGTISNAPTTLPQRDEILLNTPTITLQSGSNTAILWTSTNASVAKVSGGTVRALGIGTTVIRAASAADPSVFFEFTLTVGQPTVPWNILANFDIDSPYADVDWDTWTQYKASHHTHSWASDGANSSAQAAERHYELGYHILANTDHDRLQTLPHLNTLSGGSPANSANLPPTLEQVTALQTGSAVSANAVTGGMGAIPARPAGADGMIWIPYTNEHSGIRFDQITQTPAGHHVNTFWANIPSTSLTPRESIQDLLGRVAAAGGIAFINHPGRYTLSQYPVQPYSEAAAIANDAANFMPYVDVFMAYPAAIGMEIINKFDTESQAERILWDNILSVTMPQGRAVWGFSNDDSHANDAVGYAYNLMVMPSLTEANVRTSMENGTFLAFTRVDRQYQVRPGNINSWDWNATAANEAVLSMAVPVVRSIDITYNSIKIDATYNGAAINTGTTTFIDWYADGVMIHRGNTLNLRAFQLNVYSYVRATIVTPTGVIYVQPFGISSAADCDVVCEKDNGNKCWDCENIKGPAAPPSDIVVGPRDCSVSGHIMVPVNQWGHECSNKDICGFYWQDHVGATGGEEIGWSFLNCTICGWVHPNPGGTGTTDPDADKTISEDDIRDILKDDEPVLDLRDSDATILTPDLLQLIKDSGKEVTVIIDDGVSIIINPDDITDDMGAVNLDIDVTTASKATEVDGAKVPANSIILGMPDNGENGFPFGITISADQLKEAGINGNNVKLYFIDENGLVTKLDMIKLNPDGSITILPGAIPLSLINFSGIYSLVLTEGEPLSAVETNPNTMVSISFIPALVTGSVAVLTARRKKRRMLVN
ncbi:MAG: hypothetical protein FWD34_10445 [Oscillospiraceae bacterium]|nr:hypothetical protein [Oscillospiraceae bacterium]